MKFITCAVGATLVSLLPLVVSEQWIGERSPDTIFYAEGINVPAPIQYNGTSSKKSGAAMNGRSLIESWLNPRQLVCTDPGWQPCAGQPL
jgi:hypothetical protein